MIKYTVFKLLKEKKIHRSNLLTFLFDPKQTLSKKEKEMIVDEIGRLNQKIIYLESFPISEMYKEIVFPEEKIKSKIN